MITCHFLQVWDTSCQVSRLSLYTLVNTKKKYPPWTTCLSIFIINIWCSMAYKIQYILSWNLIFLVYTFITMLGYFYLVSDFLDYLQCHYYLKRPVQKCFNPFDCPALSPRHLDTPFKQIQVSKPSWNSGASGVQFCGPTYFYCTVHFSLICHWVSLKNDEGEDKLLLLFKDCCGYICGLNTDVCN